jgi:hypothetical protein
VKCTRGAEFYMRLDNVLNENIVAEFIYNIDYKKMAAVDLTTGCLKTSIFFISDQKEQNV